MSTSGLLQVDNEIILKYELVGNRDPDDLTLFHSIIGFTKLTHLERNKLHFSFTKRRSEDNLIKKY